MNWKKLTNPLEPRTPNTPPWDSRATANGVYLTSSLEISADYAYIIGEDDASTPLIIGINAETLRVLPDPQILDLLQEPYDEYRISLLDWIQSEFTNQRLLLKENGLSKEEARSKLGKFFDFAKKMLLLRYQEFRSAGINYPSAGDHYKDKQNAAQAILPREECWRPLTLFHQVYGKEVWPHLWTWLNWVEDSEESEYSGQRFFCRLQASFIPDPIIVAAGKMFYSPEAINSTQITRIWRIINDTLELSLEQIKEVTIEAFHGTSLKRAQEAFPDLNWTNRNPDDEIRALERLTQERPDDEDVAFRYRQALLRSGKLPSIPCLWCEGTGERQILQSDPNYRIPCYHCGAHGRRTRDQNLTDTANNERTITQTEDYFGPGGHLESDYRLTMQGLNHTSKMLTQERQLMNQALLG